MADVRRLLLVLPQAAPAQQDYPSRPVSMVVAAAAGGPIDVFARIMAERMSPILGQRVVVENVGGGGGTLGGQRVARPSRTATPPCSAPSPPTPIRSSTATSRSMIRSAISSPVALIAEIPLILIARKDFPANTFEEFVAYAKANPAS